MASNSETGHPKNVANFEDLISFCTGYGATYNPVKASIKIPALNIVRTNGQNALTAVNVANTGFINTTNARVIVFDPLKPLSTRIVNALSATDASDELIEDAKTINRKIQGSRKKPLPPPDPNAPADTTSVSQQSYDNLIENFARLVELVKSEPTYTPNEVDLQTASLDALVLDLRAKNTAVVNATTAVSNSRIARNKVLYLKDTGLVDIAAEVKKYVKSVFGASSPEYKQVSKIKFTKPR